MNLPGFGPEQQARLHAAHVLVIGAGGLGCPVMQALAATGVGEITVVDDDVVSLSNIHRQILFGAPDVGRKKVEVAAERLRELQPGITVHAVDARLDEENILASLEGIDVLIDGSDTFTTKFLAADAAEISGTPLVWGSVLRYRGDVALWWSGPGAPADGAGMRDLYPAQPDPDSVPDCATAGVLGVTTSVVGSLMSTEAVKFIAGVGEAEVGRLHMYDALTASLRHFTVRRDPARALVTSLGTYTAACAAPGGESDEDRLGRELIERLARGDAQSLDVREPHEKVLEDIAAAGPNLPMSEVEADPEAARATLAGFPAGTEVVVYCASGRRSQGFVDKQQPLAGELGLTLRSLPGGVQRWGNPDILRS